MAPDIFIEAVLFDVDGVVVESELLHLATFNDTLAPLGITISKEDWLKRFLGKGSAAIIEALFVEHSIPEEPAPWITRRRQLFQQRVAAGELPPIPGFLDFYSSIQEATLKVAFVSTGHPTNIAAALRSLGLEGKHPIIDSTQVRRLKPDPEAYLLAAQTLQVTPEHCLVFEDSPIGVAAAKAASMWCVALTTTNPASDLQNADLIIPNFHDLTIITVLNQLKANTCSSL